MAVIDLVGIPIPVDHPEFKNDMELLKRIKQVESFIELKHDMEDTEEALMALRNSLKDENQKSITSLFGCIPWKFSEFILSYIVVLYAKAFTESTGRTSLCGKVDEIFRKDTEKHTYIMGLRSEFYAHHAIEANRHQLFFSPNVPSRGKIKLNPSGQTTRIIMPKSIDLEKIDFCVSKVGEHLRVGINGLCKCIEDKMSDKQLEILTKTPKDELLNKHWRETPENRINPFLTRKK